MDNVNRRTVLTLALATVATVPALWIPAAAAAERYRPDEGEQLAPGVRRIQLSKRASEIPTYAAVSMIDIVFQPNSKYMNPAMASDMVCHCLEGELVIDQGMGTKFMAKAGDVWSCRKGMPETTENKSGAVSIMRIIPLLASK